MDAALARTRLRRVRHLLTLLAVLSLTLAACDDDGSSTPPESDAVDVVDVVDVVDAVDLVDDTTTDDTADDADATDLADGDTMAPDANLACTPDPAVIAEARRCLDDDHCPCGSHCELGQCVATCMTSAECETGQACDQFGRCRGAAPDGTLERVPLRVPVGQGNARVDQLAVEYKPDAVQRITVSAVDGPVDAVRVASPSPRVEIALAPDEADDAALVFGHEVVVDEPLVEGAHVSIAVRPTPGTEPTAGEPFGTEEIDVFDSGGNHDALIVTDDTPLLDELVAPPLEGRYEGVIRLSVSGIDNDGGVVGVNPERDVSTPVEVEIYPAVGDRAVVVIHDPMRMLHPSGRWVGELVLDADPHLELPAFEKLANTPVIGSDVQIVAVADDAQLRQNPLDATWRGQLQGQLGVRFEGSTTTRRLGQVWSFGLRRSADLPADATAPMPDAAATPIYDPMAQANTPFAAEAAFLDAVENTETASTIFHPFANVDLLWALDRTRWTDGGATACTSLGIDRGPLRANLLSSFANRALSDDHDLHRFDTGLGPAWDAAFQGIYDTAATVAWADVLAGVGRAAPMSSGLLDEIADAIVFTAGDTAEVELQKLFVRLGSSSDDYVFPLANGELVETAVPCAFDFTGIAQPTPAQWLQAFNDSRGDLGHRITIDASSLGVVDVCTEMKATYGCEVIDLAAEGIPTADRTHDMRVTLAAMVDTAFYTSYAFIDGTGLVHAKACVVPETPRSCAESVLCTEGDAIEGLNVSLLGTMTHPISGDIGCATTPQGVGLPVDESPAPADTLLADCIQSLDTLDTLDAAAFTVTGTTTAERLASIGVETTATCLEPVRYIAALGVTSAAARQLGRVDSTRADPLAELLFARQVQRLLEIASFVASESASGSPILAEFTQTTAVADMEYALQESLDTWLVVFHPRVASALNQLADAALIDPDYRTRLIASPISASHHSVDEGLVVTMMTTLATQLELATRIATVYARREQGVMPDSVVTAMHRIQLADAMVGGLFARAEAGAETAPPWLEDYQAARARYEAARAEFSFAIASLAFGTNPLGIEDADLPLYFRQIASDAGSRYTAITDYILGDGPTGNAIAQVLVADAMAAFDAARQAYLAESQRLINVENEASALAMRVGNAKQELGQTLEDLCGRDTFAPLDAGQIPDNLPIDFDVRTCWFRGDSAECGFDSSAGETDASTNERRRAQLARDLCGWSGHAYEDQLVACVDYIQDGQTNTSCVHSMSPSLELNPVPALEEIQRLAVATWSGLATETVRHRGQDVVKTVPYLGFDGGGEPLFGICNRPDLDDELTLGDGVTVVKQVLLLPEVLVDADTGRVVLRCEPAPGLSGATIEVALDSPSDVRVDPQRADTATPAFDRLSLGHYCDAQFPPVPRNRVPSGFDVAPASCYQGTLGNEAIALKTLMADYEIARSEHLDAIEAYEIAMESCFILQSGNSQLNAAQSAYQTERQALVELRTAMEIGSVVMNNTADCLDTLSGADFTKSLGVGVALAGGSCYARVAEAAFHTVQLVTEANIEAADTAHDTLMLSIETSTAERQCFKEAELELVAADTSALDIKRAMQEMEVGYTAFNNSLEQAELAVVRGYANIADAEASGVRTVDRDPWFNRDLERYADKLELARRGAYLAVRAVEYEFQTTLSQRGSVLRAETADELEQVLTELRQITATGSVNGAQPAELTEVVSLRQHLLQLADQSDAPASEQVLSDIERFRLALQDPANEVYEAGVFIGRAIPFQIAPLSVFDRGQITGVPIVSDNACGERLWALNVSIQGDPAATFRGTAPQVNLQVRKRNTAYSNWCEPTQHTDAFQRVSVRPRRNLFRIPGAGEGITLDGGDPTEDFAVARVQALLDVPASEFLTDAYTDGASTELAARPLFGDYELFIPATSLVEVDASGQPASDGLVLNQVDDILLRVDYLSVAN